MRRWLVERFFAWIQWQRRILVRWEYHTENGDRPARAPCNLDGPCCRSCLYPAHAFGVLGRDGLYADWGDGNRDGSFVKDVAGCRVPADDPGGLLDPGCITLELSLLCVLACACIALATAFDRPLFIAVFAVEAAWALFMAVYRSMPPD